MRLPRPPPLPLNDQPNPVRPFPPCSCVNSQMGLALDVLARLLRGHPDQHDFGGHTVSEMVTDSLTVRPKKRRFDSGFTRKTMRSKAIVLV
jgi:hypothetical protein